MLGTRLLPQSYQYPNLSEGADRVGGQLCGDKECPFSGVTKSGRVWRKVPESGAQSVVWRVAPTAAAWAHRHFAPALCLKVAQLVARGASPDRGHTGMHHELLVVQFDTTWQLR